MNDIKDTKEYQEALEVERMLNRGNFDADTFAQAFKTFHPTLQQKFFRLIRAIVAVQAEDNRYYDARNTASHELSKKLKPIFDESLLPYV